jgi:hypothetical protein
MQVNAAQIGWFIPPIDSSESQLPPRGAEDGSDHERRKVLKVIE